MELNPHPYEDLTPELVLDAVESAGLLTDLRILTLNSYENRVFQIGLDEGEPIIAKFYRPQRWSDAQILEEHSFGQELVDAEIPLVQPLTLTPRNAETSIISLEKNPNAGTLLQYRGFRFSLYQRKGGRAPELEDLDCLLMLGRLVARIHAVGSQRDFQHRPTLDIDSFGEQSYQFVSESFIPKDLHTAYVTLCEDLMAAVRVQFDAVKPLNIRVHGDCHVGNILWRDDFPHFVDLDDSRMAPAIQDLWMFISGDRNMQTAQMSEIVEGYNEFFDFDPRQLHLIESMRSLRIIYYSAWLARRWQDPAFVHHFPWFNTVRYWSDHILELREQLALLNEPALALY